VNLAEILANCAGMNIPPSEAKRMTLWEYDATLTEWNRQRDPDGDAPPPMTVDEFREQEQFFEDNPHLLH
jgi:hypothetical protein